MSDEQRNEEPEVEAHRLKPPHATNELLSELEGSDFEAHRLKPPHASDEPRSELEDDEVEAHVRRHNVPRKD